MSSRFGIGALVVLAVMIVGTASAQGAVTRSSVTTPASPFHALDDEDAAVPATLAVSGTSNGTTGDTVDMVCTYDGTNSDVLVSNVPVAANGDFSGSGPLGNVTVNACFMRAVPDEGALDSLNNFRGPKVIASSFARDGEVVGGPNNGALYDYDVYANGLAGYWDLASFSGDAISDGSAYGLPTFDDEAGSWDNGADFPAQADEEPRGSLVIDGHNAYGPAAAAGLFAGSDQNVGFQPVTFSTTLDPASGNLTVTESAALVRCPTDTVPATAGSCPSFLPTGVRIDRTHVVREGSLQDRITDSLVSTDGAQHSADLLYENDFEDTETGWALPPYDRLGRYNNNVLTAAELPAAPFTLIAKEADDEPDGSIEAGYAGLTFAAVPTELRWTDEDVVQSQYSLTVAAGGSVAVQQSYSQALDKAHIIELGARAEDAYDAPETTIVKSPPKKTKKKEATFEFVSSDAGSTFECKLDKKAFTPCTSPQTYKNVKKGKHTFEVRATDSAGNVDATPAKDKWKVKKKKKKGKGKGGKGGGGKK